MIFSVSQSVFQSWIVNCHSGGLIKVEHFISGGRVKPEITIWELSSFPLPYVLSEV